MAAAEHHDDATSMPRTFAEKLNRCFITMHPKDRKSFTLDEVSKGLAALGVSASGSHLHALRTGKRDNPGLKTIEGLAQFFHVPMSYFVGQAEEVERIDAQMAVVRAMRNPGVRDVALRAGDLSPAGLRTIAAVLNEIETVQGLGKPPRRQQRPSENEPAPPSDHD